MEFDVRAPPARPRSSPTRSSISASGRATSSTTISGTSSLRSNRRRSRRPRLRDDRRRRAWSSTSSPSPASRRTTPATRSRRPRRHRGLLRRGDPLAGRMARIAPLQYDYNDLGGAVKRALVGRRARRLGRRRAAPRASARRSFDDVDAALAGLQASLRQLCALRPLERDLIVAADDDRLCASPTMSGSSRTRRPRHGSCSATAARRWSSTTAIAAASASTPRRARQELAVAVLSDAFASARPPPRRRGAPRELGVDRIDVVLLSHFHDDHVCRRPALPPSVRDASAGCRRTSPTCSPTGRRTASPATGRSRSPSTGACPRPDLHLGGIHLPPRAHVRPHTLRGGDLLRGRRQTLRPHRRPALLRPARSLARHGKLAGGAPEPERGLPERRLHPQLSRQRGAASPEWRPDIIISGHQHAMHPDQDLFRLLTWGGGEFERIHRAAMVLGDDEAHSRPTAGAAGSGPTASTSPRVSSSR